MAPEKLEAWADRRVRFDERQDEVTLEALRSGRHFIEARLEGWRVAWDELYGPDSDCPDWS